MLSNRSPWIQQLNRTRPIVPLDADVSADVVIVGGGIAGAATAFFTLRDTQQSVALLEADKVAHGATGHNAGQIASYFERPLSELVAKFGQELAIDGQRSVESGWMLLEQIVSEAGLRGPLHRFTGYAGLSTKEQVLLHLKDNQCRKEGGLPTEDVLVAEEWAAEAQLPEEYRSLYSTVAHSDLLALLDTQHSQYIALLSYQKGCMNSALFVEEVFAYLIATYPDRFSLYEGSPVTNVRVGAEGATLEVLGKNVQAGKVVLCTNGFESFSIQNESGPEIDTEFHHSVMGRIGYMCGYVEPLNRPPVAISYFPKVDAHSVDPTGEDYFYLTRRPHEHEGDGSYNLTCTGGPEKVLPNGATYSREDLFPEEVQETINDFLRSNYEKHPPDGEFEYAFSWHGLMGYTPNGVRRIGFEPHNQNLLYNLGCNGVGILPSLYGGKRISELLAGKTLAPSIFDPLKGDSYDAA